MTADPPDPDWAIADLTAAGRHRFGLAYPTAATPDTDPVADQYRGGRLDHLTTLIDIALAVLRPGDRVLDLGAHLGGFALTVAAAGCPVLAVEASPANAALLRRSVAHNALDRMTVIHAAVGAAAGTLEFSSRGPWGHVAVPGSGLPVVSVPAVRVDDLLADRGWENVAFVKLDVEGSEIAAARGMPTLLGRRDAPVVFFESNRHTLGFYQKTHTELKDEFRRLGFDIYAVRPGELTWVGRAEEQADLVADYLAVKGPLPAGLAGREKPQPTLWTLMKRRLGLA